VRYLYLLVAVMCLVAANSVSAAGPSVTLTPKADAVDVTIDGKPFTVFNTSSELPKPFFSPVRGADGTVMTRPIAKPGDDHPHHKGIWLAVDKVNGVDFWAERGRIENRSVKLHVADGNPAVMQVVNDWLGKDGQPVVTENTTVRIFANRLIGYDVTYQPCGESVTFGDTKEGLFGFRMIDSMREREGGNVVNADGDQGSAKCWGKPSDWVDYHGPIEGKTYGVAIFDHPLNFRPSRYHVRNYGLFSISPFGERAYTNGAKPASPYVILPGDELRLRYAMYIHAGDTEAADVDGAYRAYLKSAE